MRVTRRLSLTIVKVAFVLPLRGRAGADELRGLRAAGSVMDEIERLEIRIEEFREAIARSRRLRLVGLASAVIGPALIVGFVLGLVDYSPTRVIVAFALAIGGMVLMGSSRSSTEELERALKQAEAERVAAIDALELVQVGDGKG